MERVGRATWTVRVARVAARESGDERVKSLTLVSAHSGRLQIRRSPSEFFDRHLPASHSQDLFFEQSGNDRRLRRREEHLARSFLCERFRVNRAGKTNRACLARKELECANRAALDRAISRGRHRRKVDNPGRRVHLLLLPVQRDSRFGRPCFFRSRKLVPLFSGALRREPHDARRLIAASGQGVFALRACNRNRTSRPRRFALVFASNVASMDARRVRPRPARKEKTVSQYKNTLACRRRLPLPEGEGCLPRSSVAKAGGEGDHRTFGRHSMRFFILQGDKTTSKKLPSIWLA